MLTIGIVGAGPCGLYIALQILRHSTENTEIHLFEADARVGGRTRMGKYNGVDVVTGAGIVRERDERLRRLATSLRIPLHRFVTKIQYDGADEPMPILKILRDVETKVDRRETFAANMRRLLGEDGYRRFRETVGATDYEEADPCDTLLDFGFEDNTPDQVLYGIDWDALSRAMAYECHKYSTFHLHRSTRIESVDRVEEDGFVLNHRWRVDDLFWTAPRPSWAVLPIPSSPEWSAVMDGVACQSFLRAYASPVRADRDRARTTYPVTTYLPDDNPLQKILPYKDDVYMIAYCDNAHADMVHRHGHDPQWFRQWTEGIRWQKPILYYHPCGTHFFRPLDGHYWKNRNEFLRYAQHPIPHLFLCGEGLSRNQGWTEGALESADRALNQFFSDR